MSFKPKKMQKQQMLPSGNTRLVYIQGQTGFSTSGRARVLKKYFGLGIGLGTGYLYQIPIQLGIIGYCNLDREFAEYLPYFLYFLIFDILYTAPLLWRESVIHEVENKS